MGIDYKKVQTSIAIGLGALSAIGSITSWVYSRYNNVGTMAADRSLHDITKLTRVEPLTIISKDLINQDYIKDVSQTALSMFIGYYLQAVAIVSNVKTAEVIRVLDALNPERDSTGFLMEESLNGKSLGERYSDLKNLSMESYKYQLPTRTSLALEAGYDFANKTKEQEESKESDKKLLIIEEDD